MYDFYYNFIKKKYNDKAKLLFTDTNSLMMEIETADIYKDIYAYKEKFDKSDYNKNSKFYDDTKKKAPGLCKDETNGIPTGEFGGLKSKMHSYLIIRILSRLIKFVKESKYRYKTRFDL